MNRRGLSLSSPQASGNSASWAICPIFLFYLQGVDLPLCLSVKTHGAVGTFSQLRAAVQVFCRDVPRCRSSLQVLTALCALCHRVAAGLEGTFSVCPRMQPSQLMPLCHIMFQGSMSYRASARLRALWPFCDPV